MEIYTITQENIEEKIGKIEVSSTVKTDIRNAVNKGRVVLIPEKNMKINDWEGTGYIVQIKKQGQLHT